MNRPVIAFCIVLTALVALVAFLHGTVTLSDEVSPGFGRACPGPKSRHWSVVRRGTTRV